MAQSPHILAAGLTAFLHVSQPYWARVQQVLVSCMQDGVCVQDEAGLLMQLDAIQGTGTIIIISNLRRNSAHQLELDFDADDSDIRIAADPPEEGSASPAPNYQQSRATQPKEV